MDEGTRDHTKFKKQSERAREREKTKQVKTQKVKENRDQNMV